MFESTDIREWRGKDVIDTDDKKVGTLEAIYVDTVSDQPVFATVRTGMPTRHRLVFVPLEGTRVGPGYIKVAWQKKQVTDGPSIDTDGELFAENEPDLFSHYELAYQPGSDGGRRLARR